MYFYTREHINRCSIIHVLRKENREWNSTNVLASKNLCLKTNEKKFLVPRKIKLGLSSC